MERVEEERVSVRSGGRSPLGTVKRWRRSIRSSRSPAGKGAKGSGGPACPPSPSPSAASLVLSPLKNMGFFQRSEADSPSPKTKGLSRSNTVPSIVSKPLRQRGAQIRRSLFGTRRERKDVTGPVNEGPREETTHEEEEEADEEAEEELEEKYTLPELPHMPLSVMQINKLIENEVLEEAYLNLLALRVKLQRGASECNDDVAKQEKDVNLLYDELKAKVCAIVRDSNSLPARNKKLLEFVARIVQEEERRSSEPGGLHGSWMDFWRSAVQDGVQATVDRVQLETRAQNQSWLAVHLGILGKTVVADLEGVRRELRWSYPPSFEVFSEYVRSYNRVLGQHVKRLETQTTEVKDMHSLLSWILIRYKSASVLGHVSLQADTRDECRELELEPAFVSQLKEKYCSRVQEQLRSSLGNVTSLESSEFWSDRKEPATEDGILISELHMDIWTLVKGFVTQSRAIEAELGHNVTCCCLNEITHFPKRFELDYRRQCDVLRPQHIWTQYHITYINSFSVLLEHMEGYRQACPSEVESLSKEIKRFSVRLLQDLQDQFKDQVKIPLRRMMTRKWLTTNEDFKDLHMKTKELSQHCSVLKQPHSQELASALHLHVSREYLEQLMKGNFSCKNRKHEKAADKIRAQWGELQELFSDMESCHEWLRPVGGALCDIIGQKHTSEIKNHLGPIVQHCPDFGKKHLVCVLWFRGLVRGTEHGHIVQRLLELKRKAPPTAPPSDPKAPPSDPNTPPSTPNPPFFSDMRVTLNQDCLSLLHLSCLSLCTPRH